MELTNNEFDKICNKFEMNTMDAVFYIINHMNNRSYDELVENVEKVFDIYCFRHDIIKDYSDAEGCNISVDDAIKFLINDIYNILDIDNY